MIERDDMYPSLLYQECLSETTGRRSDRRSIAKEGVECTQPKDGEMGWNYFYITASSSNFGNNGAGAGSVIPTGTETGRQ